MSGASSAAHRKIAGDPHRHLALPIKHLSPNILLYKFCCISAKRQTSGKWSDVIAILSIVLEASE
jgi:hypothetical protein